jgi:hypothetical protein
VLLLPTLASAKYVGCFADKSERDLTGYHYSGKMTNAICIAECKKRGFKYASTQYSSHCFCGNSYGRYGISKKCDYKCTGNKGEVCGGYWANSVYTTGATGSPAGNSHEFCQAYANQAVSQNAQNVKLRCGFTGGRWQSDFQRHYNWCRKAPAGNVNGESRARSAGLDKCQARVDAANKNQFCTNYANTAIAQQNMNLQRRCGFTGGRWLTDFRRHFN